MGSSRPAGADPERPSAAPAASVDIKERERGFHDDWASSIEPASVLVIESFTASTCPENRWIFEQLGDVRGKKILELGSGAGEGAVFFALRGGEVTATDISPGMLEVVERVAAHHGTRVNTKVCSADDLSAFRDGEFDIVYGANLLHHVDLMRCIDEVHRILKPGGMAAFFDPVAYNPAINVYRRMAMQVRTIDEHPLQTGDIKYVRSRFGSVRTRFFWFTTLLVFVKFYLVDRIHPNADRYWKRIITQEPKLRWWYRPLAFFDRAVLTVLPFFRWWCWNVAIVARK